MPGCEKIRICDCTLRQGNSTPALSFREKIELCRLLDQLNVDVIELNGIVQKKTDSLLIKSVCNAVQHAKIAVPVRLNAESVEETWQCLKDASSCRLQIVTPVSSVQMEYLCQMKPASLLSAFTETVKACLVYTDDVELIAEDATRSDGKFLRQILQTAVEFGVKTITLCDTAGSMLPEEAASFLLSLFTDLPELSNITVGYACSNRLFLADACAVSAVQSGVREIKASAYTADSISLENFSHIIHIRGNSFSVSESVNVEKLHQLSRQIRSLCMNGLGLRHEAGENVRNESSYSYSVTDTPESIRKAVVRLGYDLSQEDLEKVWNRFAAIAAKKESISSRELEAIVATEAMQVPPVYHDLQYVISTGNTVGAMSHLKLMFHEQPLEGIASGDGAIDAAFNSIEKAIGRHFELDDFQIQSVTEGREAMGETIVRLRSDGKLYSGRGISTDIVGAGIMAYINALNKIVYEEEEDV